MNEVQLFDFDGQNVKATLINNEPYFLFTDISDILEYKNNRDALRYVDKNDVKTLKWKACRDTRQAELWTKKNDYSNKNVINEGGLFRLIRYSEAPQADKFNRWVDYKLLPKLRHEWSISKEDKQANDLAEMPSYEILSMATKIAKQKAQAEAKVAKMKPDYDYFNNQMVNPGLTNTTTVAKKYGWTPSKMHNILHDLRVIYKKGSTWHLYNEYSGYGYADYHFASFNNNQGTSQTLKWTQKGIKMIHDLLSNKNILPELEQPNLLEDNNNTK